MYFNQHQFTTIVPINPLQKEQLKLVLKDIGESDKTISKNHWIDFSKMTTLHYCRWFVADEIENPDGSKIPDQLVFSTICDGTIQNHLNEWYAQNKRGMDEIFRHCLGYPLLEVGDEKTDWLRKNRQKESLFWPCKMGGKVDMIIQENYLHNKIQNHLDQQYQTTNLSQQEPSEIFGSIKNFVKGNSELQWALIPEPKPNFFQNLWNYFPVGILFAVAFSILASLGIEFYKTVCHVNSFHTGLPHWIPYWSNYISLGFGGLILLLIIWIALAFYFEEVDNENWKPTPLRPIDETLKIEDRYSQNQLTIYATMKNPNWFRVNNLRLFLFIANAKMHYTSKGNNGGIRTIHFVSWIIFNRGKNGMFLSNYDGGWNSYLCEFVDAAASIMNLSFGNLKGYPKIHGLLNAGAHYEQNFKQIVRQNQYPAQVWYSAYPEISVRNLCLNAKVRQGLSQKMNETELKDWLRNF